MKTKKITLNDYEMFHDANLYLPTRTIYFGGQYYDEDVVTSQTVSQLIKNLHILEHREEAPISILLNTRGGSWEDGIAVYDVIKSLKSIVTIVGIGKVYSMGSVILQSADKRLLMENTHVMIHDGTEYYEGDPKMVERWIEVSKTVRFKMYDIYWQRMKNKKKRLKFKDVEALCAVDTIYSADEAVKVGLADKIIKEVKSF